MVENILYNIYYIQMQQCVFKLLLGVCDQLHN